MAHRIGGLECPIAETIRQTSIATAEENTMAVFQYMIGNEDWNRPDVKYQIDPVANGGRIVPVPYDFSFPASSAFVCCTSLNSVSLISDSRIFDNPAGEERLLKPARL